MIICSSFFEACIGVKLFVVGEVSLVDRWTGHSLLHVSQRNIENKNPTQNIKFWDKELYPHAIGIN